MERPLDNEGVKDRARRTSGDDPIDSFLGVIDRRLKVFRSDAANKIFVIDHGDQQGTDLLRSYAASADSDIVALLGHEPAIRLGHFQREGLYLMAAALSGPCPNGTYTVVAVHGGHPVAAVRFDHHPGTCDPSPVPGERSSCPGCHHGATACFSAFGVETGASGVSGFLTADLVPYERAIGRVVDWASDLEPALNEERIETKHPMVPRTLRQGTCITSRLWQLRTHGGTSRRKQGSIRKTTTRMPSCRGSRPSSFGGGVTTPSKAELSQFGI